MRVPTPEVDPLRVLEVETSGRTSKFRVEMESLRPLSPSTEMERCRIEGKWNMTSPYTTSLSPFEPRVSLISYSQVYRMKDGELTLKQRLSSLQCK